MKNCTTPATADTTRTARLRERISNWADDRRVGGTSERWWFCLRIGRNSYLYLDEMIAWVTCRIWGHEWETTPAIPIFDYCRWCPKTRD